MDAPCDVFFAGAGLAPDEDGGVRGGDLAHELAHFAHFACVADEFAWNPFNDVADFLAFLLMERLYGFEVLLQNAVNAL